MTLLTPVPVTHPTRKHRAPRRVLVVLGTRPEVIKLAPVLLALRDSGDEVALCAVGQQQRVLDDALAEWELLPDHFVPLYLPDRRLGTTLGGIVSGVQAVIEEAEPDFVLVQGDTTTTLGASLAAFYGRVPVGHVEAGLRSGNVGQPFPEEMHRQLADRLASVHYVATSRAKENLLAEGYGADTISVVGNTVVDALFHMRGRAPLEGHRRSPGSHEILVTSHRRESFGPGLRDVAYALRTLVELRQDISVTYVLHPNPAAREAAQSILGRVARVELVEPQGYRGFVALLARSHIIISDSGGVQEEAPYLGKPVLVTRRVTERPEAVALGVAKIVGTNAELIIATVMELLDNPAAYAHMARVTAPFGDGRAAERIVKDLHERLASGAVPLVLAPAQVA